MSEMDCLARMQRPIITFAVTRGELVDPPLCRLLMHRGIGRHVILGNWLKMLCLQCNVLNHPQIVLKTRVAFVLRTFIATNMNLMKLLIPHAGLVRISILLLLRVQLLPRLVLPVLE